MEWMILPFKRYTEFSGRSRRIEYWLFALLQFFLYLVFAVVFGVVAFSALSSGTVTGVSGMIASMGVAALIFGLIWLALLIPAIAVAVRRLHDSERSGWWLMIYAVPYVLSVVVRVTAITSGGPTLALAGTILSLVSLIAGLVLLVFMCLPGTVGPNRYGPDPLFPDRNFAETFR